MSGKVLRAETNAPPSPAATVTIGGVSAQTAADGTFTLSNVSASATTATVSAQGTQTRTLAIKLKANQNNNLGSIFLSDTGYTATVTGRVVTMVNNQTQPVANATVTIAGASTQTATDGTFTLNNLPIGLGNTAGTVIGEVTAQGFANKDITSDMLPAPLVAGSNDLGDVLISAPVGTIPLPPYTITGVVTVQGKPTSGVTVALSSGGTSLGTTTTDANGAYFFWVVPGTYTVKATSPKGATQQVNVTLAQLNTPVTATTINLAQ